jgi:hypothetical protein
MKNSTPDERLIEAIRSVLPGVAIRSTRHPRWTSIALGSTELHARWLVHGWPDEVRRAAEIRPKIDLIVASKLSEASREIAREAGIGWMDETGAAELIKGAIVISRGGHPQPNRPIKGWTRAVIAAAEAILCGTRATVDATASATGLSTGAVASALSFLAEEGFLTSMASRGRNAARILANAETLLAAYAAAAESRGPRDSLAVGVLWRDPIRDAAEAGVRWTSIGRAWSATSALAAAALAPCQTEIAPLEIYVEASGVNGLRLAAEESDLAPIEGGRLVLRPFPVEATSLLSERQGDIVCAPWPRVFVDLRRSGVRGEEAAEHLREAFTTARE